LTDVGEGKNNLDLNNSSCTRHEDCSELSRVSI